MPVCVRFKAVVYREYAIRPYNNCKTITAWPFSNTPKTTSDIGKTMSYVEKIMSDVVFSTSDIIFAFTML